MAKPKSRQREYVSGRISLEVMAIVIRFTFVAAMLNISISPRVPEWNEPDSGCIGLQDYNLGLLLHKTPNIGRPTPNYNKSQHFIVTNFATPDFD